MLSLILLASAFMLGLSVSRRLGLRPTPLEWPSLSVVLGLVLWTWLAFLCALVLPFAASLPLTIVLAGLISFWLWRGAPAWRLTPWTPRPAERLVWAGFTVATLILFSWLMWTHDLLPFAGGLYSANSTWADFGLHAAIISHFSTAPSFSFDFPVAAGTTMTYPFLVDFLSALLVKGGFSLHAAIFIPSLLFIMAFLQLMISFGARLFKGRTTGSIIGLAFTLCAGSAVGIFTAISDLKASNLPWTAFLGALPKDYTALSTPNAQVTNFVADLMLPQRSFLMGIALFAAILVLMTELRRRASRPLAIFLGALIGLLPLIHAHTFVVLAALLLSLWLEAYLRDRRFLNHWFIAGAVTLALALPQIIWQSLANHTGTGGHPAWGWVINPGETLLSFWSHNYGFTLPLMIIAAVVLIWRRDLRRYAVWLAPFLAVFVLANMYSLQPFAYDNLKLIAYAYLMTYLFAGYAAVWLVRQSRLYLAPIALAGLLVSASGLLAITREFQHADQFASADDLAAAAWVQSHTAPSDVFITTDRPNQPIAALAGRSIIAGYRGWLYNYHLDYQPRLDTVSQALAGEVTAANPYHAKYVAVGSYEAPEWTINQPALQANYSLVYQNPSWTIYRLP